MNILGREILIYIVIFFILSFLIHYKACISHPIEHIKSISAAPLGVFHPFLFTFIVYLVVLVIRVIVAFVKKRI